MRRTQVARLHNSKLHGALKLAKEAHRLAALLYVLNQQPERAIETYLKLPEVTAATAALRVADVACLARLHAMAADLYAKQGEGDRAFAEQCLAAGSLAPLVEDRHMLVDGEVKHERLAVLVRTWRRTYAGYADAFARQCDDALVRHQIDSRADIAHDWLRAAQFCVSHRNPDFEEPPPAPGSPESMPMYFDASDGSPSGIYRFRATSSFEDQWQAKYWGTLVRHREIEVRQDRKQGLAHATARPMDLVLTSADVAVDAQRDSGERSASAQARGVAKRLPSGWAGHLWLGRWDSSSLYKQSWTMGTWVAPLATPGTVTAEGTVTIEGRGETTGTLGAEIAVEAGERVDVADAYWTWLQATLAKQKWLAANKAVENTTNYAKRMIADGTFALAGDILANPKAQRDRETEARERGRFLGYADLLGALASCGIPPSRAWRSGSRPTSTRVLFQTQGI